MRQHCPQRRLVRPDLPRVVSGGATLKDAARRLWRWPRGRARPSLTAAPPDTLKHSGRDEKTAPQPNQKTVIEGARGRTTHALQRADIFMRHEHISASLIQGNRVKKDVTNR